MERGSERNSSASRSSLRRSGFPPRILLPGPARLPPGLRFRFFYMRRRRRCSSSVPDISKFCSRRSGGRVTPNYANATGGSPMPPPVFACVAQVDYSQARSRQVYILSKNFKVLNCLSLNSLVLQKCNNLGKKLNFARKNKCLCCFPPLAEETSVDVLERPLGQAGVVAERAGLAAPDGWRRALYTCAARAWARL